MQELGIGAANYPLVTAPSFRCRVCDFPISLLFAARRGRTVEIVCPFCESSAIWRLEPESNDR
jgi:hypothetical protein